LHLVRDGIVEGQDPKLGKPWGASPKKTGTGLENSAGSDPVDRKHAHRISSSGSSKCVKPKVPNRQGCFSRSSGREEKIM